MKRTGVIVAAFLALPLLGSLVSDTVSAADAPKEKEKDRVVVMYFHRTQRCPTCLRMGAFTEEAVKKGFARELKEGKVSLHFIDFQDDKNAAFTNAYEITGPTLLVAKASGTKVREYKNLDEMWTKARDKADFMEYVQSNVKSYLEKAASPKRVASQQETGGKVKTQ